MTNEFAIKSLAQSKDRKYRINKEMEVEHQKIAEVQTELLHRLYEHNTACE